jgi:hypothetical protein
MTLARRYKSILLLLVFLYPSEFTIRSLPCVHDAAASVNGREGENQKHETAWSYSIQQRGVASEMVREEVESLNPLTTGLYPL